MTGAPDVLRHFAANNDGGIDLEDRLIDVPHPVLLLAGRHDRGCPASASEWMTKLIPDARLHVFEDSAHMAFVEEQDAYLDSVVDFAGGIAASNAGASDTGS